MRWTIDYYSEQVRLEIEALGSVFTLKQHRDGFAAFSARSRRKVYTCCGLSGPQALSRVRGLPDRLVYFGHALKNTLVPVITIAGLQLGAIIAFAIVTETVFQWPGMGLLFIQAVNFADVPVMAAYLCFIALVFVANYRTHC